MRHMAKSLPVHCCCDPNKLMGWIVLSEFTHIQNSERMTFPTYSGNTITLVIEELRRLDRYGDFMDKSETAHQLAFRSDEIPIEVLRKIPQFIENTQR